MTPESESWLIADSVHPSPNGEGYQVVGVYTNKPRMPLRGQRSEIQQGAFIMITHGPPSSPETLTGEYWTDRETRGQLTLSHRMKRLFTRFDDADRRISDFAHGN